MDAILKRIYGDRLGATAYERIMSVLDRYEAVPPRGRSTFSEKDVILVTYGDTFSDRSVSPLQALGRFCDQYLKDVVSTLHILPFFPYSSDDGFAVTDYFSVNPELGEWDDIHALGRNFDLMFDFVLNHVSAKSGWFDRYLKEEEGFRDLALEVSADADLSRVVRPRALPVSTEFEKASGEKIRIWTTFSEDQIDLNYGSPDVLLKMVEVLLHYVRKGASIVRLDAISYLWKEIGTECIHLPQTHDLVRLIRMILDRMAPHVALVTETNVSPEAGEDYFGDGQDEAHAAYNFTLPPLLLYTFVKEDSTVLSRHLRSLEPSSAHTTFLNVTATHDGVGVGPLKSILTYEETSDLLDRVDKNGGFIIYKKYPDGSQGPYELNITYLDAMGKGKDVTDPLHAGRFLAAQTIQFALPGVPAVYIHSLIGTRNWYEGIRKTRRARTINRAKLELKPVLYDLEDPHGFRFAIFHPYIDMIKTRIRQPAFHPHAACEIPDLGSGVFAIYRTAETQRILALTNVTSKPVEVIIPENYISENAWDVLTDTKLESAKVDLEPYQSVWLADA